MFQVILTNPHIKYSNTEQFTPVQHRLLLFLESHLTHEHATTLECTDTGRLVTKVDGGVNGDWYADSKAEG